MRPRPARKLRRNSNPLTDREQAARNSTHRRKAAKRHNVQALNASRARDLLQELPAPGESLHGIQKGNFNFFDIIPAAMQLARPATVNVLAIATLGFSRDNVDALLEMIDAGQVARVQLVASVFHQAHNPDDCAHARNGLASRGSSFHACRNHAKVICFDFTDGQAFALEGSANLRSCRMVEQFCLTHDADLVAFHRRWIEELIRTEAEAAES